MIPQSPAERHSGDPFGEQFVDFFVEELFVEDVGGASCLAEGLEGLLEVGGPEALPDDGEGDVFCVDAGFVDDAEVGWVAVGVDSGFVE